MRITYAEIENAVNADPECKGTYYMSLVGSLAEAVENVVNQGIDAHLEACFCPERGDKFGWEGGKLECEVSAKSLPVLLRRLQELADAGGLGEEDEAIVSDILGTLGISCEAGYVEIVSRKSRCRKRKPMPTICFQRFPKALGSR